MRAPDDSALLSSFFVGGSPAVPALFDGMCSLAEGDNGAPPTSKARDAGLSTPLAWRQLPSQRREGSETADEGDNVDTAVDALVDARANGDDDGANVAQHSRADARGTHHWHGNVNSERERLPRRPVRGRTGWRRSLAATTPTHCVERLARRRSLFAIMHAAGTCCVRPVDPRVPAARTGKRGLSLPQRVDRGEADGATSGSRLHLWRRLRIRL